MNFIKRIFVIISILFLSSFVFAQEKIVLEPTEKTFRNDRNCSITIECNIPNCEVYLNKVYKGKTKLTLQNLPVGEYELEIEKEGYNSVSYKINVYQSYDTLYRIALSNAMGLIQLNETFLDSEIYLDSTRVNSNPFSAYCGEHRVKVKRFGYEDFEKTVKVEKDSVKIVEYVSKPAVFALNNFDVSRVHFNPDAKDDKGICTISFEANTKGSALIYILNSTGEEVWSYEFKDIETWSQSVDWNGKDKNNQVLDDGVYTVILSSEGIQKEKTVVITNNANYPKYVYTKSGLGIGVLPLAYKSPVNFGQIEVNVRPGFNADKNNFGLSPFNAQIAFISGFTNGFEFSASASTYLTGKNAVFPFTGNFAFKYNWAYQTDKITLLNAALLRYGYSSIDLFTPYGIDTGNGLGLGYVFGIKTPKGYAGTNLDLVFGAENGKLNLNNNVVRLGLAYTHSSIENVNIDLWLDFNTAITTFNPSYKRDYNFLFMHAMECGTDVLITPDNSPFVIETGINFIFFLRDDYICEDKGNYYSFKIGLSYLF